MIRLFDKSLQLVCEVDDYISLAFERKVYGIGVFTVVLDPRSIHAKHFMNKDFLVMMDQDPRKTGLIRYYSQNDEGDASLEVKGYTLETLLKRRLALPPAGQAYDAIAGDAETVMKYFVEQNLVSAENSARNIPNFIVHENLQRGSQTKKYARYDSLLTVIQEVSALTKMGFEITFDPITKTFAFDVIEGKDHCVGSMKPVIFSMEYENLCSETFTLDATREKTTAYVGGKGEEAERSIMIAKGNVSGIERFETFVDAKDAQIEELVGIGEQELGALTESISIEGIANPDSGPFVYGQDYQLGDHVTIMNMANKEAMNVQITGIQEIYEQDGKTFELSFGKGRLMFTDILNQKFAQYDKLLRR